MKPFYWIQIKETKSAFRAQIHLRKTEILEGGMPETSFLREWGKLSGFDSEKKAFEAGKQEIRNHLGPEAEFIASDQMKLPLMRALYN